MKGRKRRFKKEWGRYEEDNNRVRKGVKMAREKEKKVV